MRPHVLQPGTEMAMNDSDKPTPNSNSAGRLSPRHTLRSFMIYAVHTPLCLMLIASDLALLDSLIYAQQRPIWTLLFSLVLSLIGLLAIGWSIANLRKANLLTATNREVAAICITNVVALLLSLLASLSWIAIFRGQLIERY
jgi:hypothetical protein